MVRWRFVLCRSISLLSIVPVRAGTLAQFRTVFGDIEVELYDQQKPGTVQNFKKLVQSGAYQNTFFHRVVPGFVAQGGGYLSLNVSNTNLFAPPWGNLGAVRNFGAISNEYAVGPHFSNTNGMIAMAKLGNNPDAATCEWFFNLANNSTNLDNQNGGFTVFGRVLRDTGPTNYGGVLGLFNLISYGNGLVNMGWWYPNDSAATGLFNTLPVIYSGFTQPRYADLFYVNVTLLSVQITITNNQRQISWNSIAGKTNSVEYTATLPANWKNLITTNGTGNRLTITDSTATNSFRFYRIRVDY